MAPFDPVMSRPAEVHFAGFRSDTYTLQQAGWRLAMEQDVRSGMLRMLMHHRDVDLHMVAADIRHNFMDMRLNREAHPVFKIIRVARVLESVRLNLDFASFHVIDATPVMRIENPRRIEDFTLFAAPLVRTEEIIIEPQSVAECLERIKALQAPNLAEIRERSRRRERLEPSNQTRFHAQILTLAA